jgi:hypothetical protein
MRSAWYVHTTSCIFFLFYAVYIICFIHSHTCCVFYCASSPSRFDSIFDTISCFFVPLELMPLSFFNKMRVIHIFLLLDSGNTPGNKILWIYGFSESCLSQKWKCVLHLGLPKWSLRRKSIQQWMVLRTRENQAGEQVFYSLVALNTAAKQQFLHIHKIWEKYIEINVNYMWRRGTQKTKWLLCTCILFFPAVRSNNFVLHFYFGTNDGIRFSYKMFVEALRVFLHGQIDCWSKRNGSIRGCFTNNERKSWIYVSIFYKIFSCILYIIAMRVYNFRDWFHILLTPW